MKLTNKLIIFILLMIIPFISLLILNTIIDSKDIDISSKELKYIINNIKIEEKSILKDKKFKIIKAEKENDKYHILITDNLVNFEIFYYKNNGLTIVGEGYSKNKQKIFFKKEKETIFPLLNKSTLLTLGTGKNEFYVFLSAYCPHCKDFAKEVNLKDNKLHIIMKKGGVIYNRDQQIEYILEGKTNKDRIKRFYKIMNREDSYEIEEKEKKEVLGISEYLDNSSKIIKLLNIEKTPTVLNTNLEHRNWTGL